MPPTTTAVPGPPDGCYVRNSSFLSRDIEAQKAKSSPPRVGSPRKITSPPSKDSVVNEIQQKKVVSPPKRDAATKLETTVSLPKMEAPKEAVKKSDLPPALPPRNPEQKVASPPKKENISPPRDALSSLKKEVVSPPKKVTSPPVSVLKSNRNDSKPDENHITPKPVKKETLMNREAPVKSEKLSLVATEIEKPVDKVEVESKAAKMEENKCNNEESNGVGDKIKKFEKAAEDANAGKQSRPGSVRGRARTERIGSDSKDDLPPATPFKDNHFDLTPAPEKSASIQERQLSLAKNSVNSITAKWPRNDGNCSDGERARPEPQKIIKPEFKPMPSSVDVPIRSPSLGVKIPDQFPSQGTAFRNVASPDTNRSRDKLNEDVNTQNNFKTCKSKNKEKYSVTKGSGYFTRGSEEIWLVKKTDIEEIEERVLDSFRRAGGNVCMRSESMRPSSDGGQSGVFTHATMGRNKRQMYARSESLDPQWAGNRAHTLKRQSSVACTCGHDKKTRAKSAGPETTPRPRSRSHGDDNNQAQGQSQGHVLDKYETLV